MVEEGRIVGRWGGGPAANHLIEEGCRRRVVVGDALRNIKRLCHLRCRFALRANMSHGKGRVDTIGRDKGISRTGSQLGVNVKAELIVANYHPGNVSKEGVMLRRRGGEGGGGGGGGERGGGGGGRGRRLWAAPKASCTRARQMF